MAATLRRTFRYPDDEDESHDRSARQELDEEEQDDIIQNLHQKNDTDNRFYLTVFTVVPLIAAIAYIPALVSSSVAVGQRLIYVVCIISLLVTAYIMQSSGSLHPSRTNRRHDDLRPPSVTNPRWFPAALDGINRRCLVYANSALCGLLALGSLLRIVDTQRGSVLYLLPAVFLAIIFLARRVTTEVDIGELEKLRYEYKGA
ncbi:hypothetical protein UA08_05787 [Talaromyces atroroseus]|uniref:Uncharacterized protein n=1 Tax=Talaromyces atroroseus TaxID=1441469 RepID=A0A225AX68_TALAT|nr:hypothetical protein UA08_05787 [Talaromyces atroroseus]OKL59045.1 hypothetical protein UA08_05787 [Talaromyces atroroseus]